MAVQHNRVASSHITEECSHAAADQNTLISLSACSDGQTSPDVSPEDEQAHIAVQHNKVASPYTTAQGKRMPVDQDDSVRCRMSHICEGSLACGPGMRDSS